MSEKSEQLEKAQARSTRRRYRRLLSQMQERYEALTGMGKPQLVKALKEAGSKASFKDKPQAILAVISAEFGADVAQRFDHKVINPPVAEEKAEANGKGTKGTKAAKAPKKSSRKSAPVAEVEVSDEDNSAEWDEEGDDEDDSDE